MKVKTKKTRKTSQGMARFVMYSTALLKSFLSIISIRILAVSSCSVITSGVTTISPFEASPVGSVEIVERFLQKFW